MVAGLLEAGRRQGVITSCGSDQPGWQREHHKLSGKRLFHLAEHPSALGDYSNMSQKGNPLKLQATASDALTKVKTIGERMLLQMAERVMCFAISKNSFKFFAYPCTSTIRLKPFPVVMSH